MGGSNFALQWPTDSGKVTVPYDPATGVLRIAAAAGATVKTAAAGKVVTVTADRIEIASDSYLLVYGNLRKVTPTVGQAAKVAIAETAVATKPAPAPHHHAPLALDSAIILSCAATIS